MLLDRRSDLMGFEIQFTQIPVSFFEWRLDVYFRSCMYKYTKGDTDMYIHQQMRLFYFTKFFYEYMKT